MNAPLWIALVVVLATVLTMLIVVRLRAVAQQRQWYWASVTLGALSNVVPLWGLLVGLFVALDRVVLPPHLATVAYDAIAVLAVLSGTWILSRFARATVNAYALRVDSRLFSESLFATVAEGVVLGIGLLCALSAIGVRIEPLLTALGIGGLAVALALRDPLANLFSGIALIASHQIRVGDVVALDPSLEGEIIDISWRVTRLRDRFGSTIVVPNEKLAGSTVRNASTADSPPWLIVPATIAWQGNVSEVLERVRDVAREVGGRLAHVRVTKLQPAEVELTAQFQVARIEDRNAVQSAYLERVAEVTRPPATGEPEGR